MVQKIFKQSTFKKKDGSKTVLIKIACENHKKRKKEK